MNDAMRPADATGPIDWRTSSLIPSQSWAWHSMDGRRRRCLPHPPTPSSVGAGTRFGSPHFGSVRGGRRPAAAAGRAHTHPHATDEEEGGRKGQRIFEQALLCNNGVRRSERGGNEMEKEREGERGASQEQCNGSFTTKERTEQRVRKTTAAFQSQRERNHKIRLFSLHSSLPLPLTDDSSR